LQPPGCWRAASPGIRSAFLWSRIAFATGWSNFPVALDNADWLDGPFSAGDLMMVSVLLRLKASGILDEYPNLAAYVVRGEARPAYQRAFDAQLAVYTGKRPSG
jgi:glutathione S-transferase